MFGSLNFTGNLICADDVKRNTDGQAPVFYPRVVETSSKLHVSANQVYFFSLFIVGLGTLLISRCTSMDFFLKEN